jgi:hypothetical protein
MIPKILRLTLKSATTFGRGDGVAGLVDREIEHDRDGFPFVRGKTLKGLLVESSENVVYAFETLQGKTGWREAKKRLFGSPGRGLVERGMLHIGDACLPKALRETILAERAAHPDEFSPDQIFDSLTSIRRQTAMNPDGGPDRTTLRSMRVLLRGVILEAHLSFETEPNSTDLQLLAAAVLDFRHAGTGRNRGRGWLMAELDNDMITRQLFNQLNEAVNQ